MDRNAIWNVCRQSGDHGPINSWDRQAYRPPLRDPTGNHKRRRDQQDASAPGGDEQQPRVSRKAARRARVCWDFAETGTCKFADKCRFRHSAPSEAPSEAAPSVGGAEPSGGAEAGEAADAGDGGESGGLGSGGAEGGCWC